MPGREGLTFRSDHLADPAGRLALADLLQDTFGIDITVLDRLGGPDPTGKAFGWLDASGACVANISTFALPLVVRGSIVHAAGLQSGAVRPGHRGRGLYRDVMEAALRHCDAAGFEAIFLLTDTPDLYHRYGFRTLPQHRFHGAAPDGGMAAPIRHLDLDNDGDVVLLRRLLQSRQPVSDGFAPLRQAEMFLFNAALMPGLRLDLVAEELVVAWQPDGAGGIDVLDIVGARIPRLADIVASLQHPSGPVTVHFSPDRLSWQGTAVADAGDMKLMLRGFEIQLPAEPFALPPMAEF